MQKIKIIFKNFDPYFIRFFKNSRRILYIYTNPKILKLLEENKRQIFVTLPSVIF